MSKQARAQAEFSPASRSDVLLLFTFSDSSPPIPAFMHLDTPL